MSQIANCFACPQNSYNGDGDERRDWYQKMLVKTSLVALYSFAINKFMFGETASESLKFGVYAGISSDVADRVSELVTKNLSLNQATNFEKLLVNTQVLSVGGGGILAMLAYNKPYGKVSQPKQVLTVVFSELLAEYMIRNYIHL